MIPARIIVISIVIIIVIIPLGCSTPVRFSRMKPLLQKGLHHHHNHHHHDHHHQRHAYALVYRFLRLSTGNGMGHSVCAKGPTGPARHATRRHS
jgi:hypothetical protein